MRTAHLRRQSMCDLPGLRCDTPCSADLLSTQVPGQCGLGGGTTSSTRACCLPYYSSRKGTFLKLPILSPSWVVLRFCVAVRLYEMPRSSSQAHHDRSRRPLDTHTLLLLRSSPFALCRACHGSLSHRRGARPFRITPIHAGHEMTEHQSVVVRLVRGPAGRTAIPWSVPRRPFLRTLLVPHAPRFDISCFGSTHRWSRHVASIAKGTSNMTCFPDRHGGRRATTTSAGRSHACQG